ncbi:nucleotide-diphospho-sugar transferase [Pyronema domesticum]|nr:nucleotide-diphospho-sugar transferase [Pyronema domesticum]
MTGDFPRQFFVSINDTPTSTSTTKDKDRDRDNLRNTPYSSRTNATPNWLATLARETKSSKSSKDKTSMDTTSYPRKDGSSASSFLSMSLRLAAKRTIFRTICILTIFMLAYHLFASVELRDIRNIREKYISDVNAMKAGAAVPAAAEATVAAPAAPAAVPSPEAPQKEHHDQVIPPAIPVVAAASQDTSSPNHLSGSKVTVGKEKATLLMLVRNRELQKALGSMRMIEDRFNRNYKYPWTFMNDKPFTEDFIKYTTGMASGPVEYVVIPESNWSVPSTLNSTVIEDGMKNLQNAGVIYGGSLSYRHMCRFNSGFFYEQEALQKYSWYWRVEPGIEFYCDITYDPFTYMRENGKVYGWVITMYEFLATIPTLFHRTKEFVNANPHVLAEDNSLNWIVDNVNMTKVKEEKKVEGEYNLCHFWSNFEIASLDFYRSEVYRKYFQWGDAPVHSLAVSLFLPRSKVHHFSDFGYSHSPAARCPQDDESHTSGRCYCDRNTNFDLDSYSCTPRWFQINGAGKGARWPPGEAGGEGNNGEQKVL